MVDLAKVVRKESVKVMRKETVKVVRTEMKHARKVGLVVKLEMTDQNLAHLKRRWVEVKEKRWTLKWWRMME